MGWISDAWDAVTDFAGDIVDTVVDWFVDIPEPPKADEAQKGTLLNKQSNLAGIPVIYGQRKIGGTRVFVETSGTDNTYLYICLVLCEGEVEEIGDIYINDVLSSDAKYSGLISIDKKLGADNQTVSTVLSAAPSWTSDHTLKGVAYLGMRFTWDRDVFGSIPDVTAVVKGRKCFNPAKDVDSTSLGTHDFDDPTTWEYTNNTAVCLFDYLTNSRYGKGLPRSAFEPEFDSWKAAVDFCDSAVPEYTGGGDIDLFDCNAVIDITKTIIENVKILLSGMQGQLVYAQGVYKLIPERDYASSFSFTEDNILGNINVEGAKRRDKYNRVIATFTNPEKNWQQDQVEYPEAGSSTYTTLLAEDEGFKLETRIALETITNAHQARNIAYTALYRSRAQLKCSFLANIEALKVAVGDIVDVTLTSLGWEAKEFRVMGLSLLPDGNVGVSLQEHDATIYTWNEDAQITAPAATTLPDPFSVANINESTISVVSSEAINDNGSSYQRFVIDWTEPNDNFISDYVVQMKEADSTDWKLKKTSDEPPVYMSDITSGSDYNLRIKAINSLGVSSNWVYFIDASTNQTTCEAAGNTWDGTRCLVNITADALTTAAGGGNTTYYQDDAPVNGGDIELATGDLWFDTNDNNKIYRYDGSSWAAASGNLINKTVTTGLSDISTNMGSIDSGSLNINDLFIVNSDGAVVMKSSTSTGVDRLVIENNVIKVIDSNNVVRIQIGDLS